MLSILITPTSLFFNDLPDDIYTVLVTKYSFDLVAYKDGHKLEGTPEQLFKALLKLSYNYDIEII